MRSMRAAVKSNSKKALRNQYGHAMVIIMLLIGINTFFMLLDAIISMVLNMPIFMNTEGYFTPSLIRDINLSIPLIVSNIVLAVLAFLVMTPFYYGINGWFFRMVGNENSEISSAFNYFESFNGMFKVWAAEISVGLRKIFYFILFILPGTFAAAIGYRFEEAATADFDHSRYILAQMIEILGLCLIIIGVLCFLIYAKKYQFVKYLIAYDSKLKGRQAIKRSIKMSNGNKLDLFVFDLSYLLWFATCIAVIPALYVLPYYMTGRALYSRVILEKFYLKEKENTEKTSAEPDFPGVSQEKITTENTQEN